jgi:hypothetical protein
MKTKLIGIFNALSWCFIMYLIYASIGSIVEWQNYFDLTNWESAGRLIGLVTVLIAFGLCVPFRKSKS